MSAVGQYGMPGGGSRLDTEVGYGVPLGAGFVGTPRVSGRTSEYGQDYRLGYGIEVLQQGTLNLQLGVDAEHRVSLVFEMREADERSRVEAAGEDRASPRPGGSRAGKRREPPVRQRRLRRGRQDRRSRTSYTSFGGFSAPFIVARYL